MEKIIALIIGLVMAFSLVGWTSKTNNQTPSTDNTPSIINRDWMNDFDTIHEGLFSIATGVESSKTMICWTLILFI